MAQPWCCASSRFEALPHQPRHSDLAQQRFPDLKRRGASDPPPPDDALEIKASIRPWALQAHYDHPGWHCVLRYLVDPSRTIEAGKYVLVWRVHIARLQQSDWKYEGSGAGPEGGGRTHTYGVIKPATKFKDTAVFSRPDIVISSGKPQGNRILIESVFEVPVIPAKAGIQVAWLYVNCLEAICMDSRFRGNDDLSGHLKLECVCPAAKPYSGTAAESPAIIPALWNSLPNTLFPGRPRPFGML